MGTHKKSDQQTRKRKYELQRAKTEANRKRRFLKHKERHPNDKTESKKVQL